MGTLETWNSEANTLALDVDLDTLLQTGYLDGEFDLSLWASLGEKADDSANPNAHTKTLTPVFVGSDGIYAGYADDEEGEKGRGRQEEEEEEDMASSTPRLAPSHTGMGKKRGRKRRMKDEDQREKTRKLKIDCEKRRRSNINDSMEALRALVPSCDESSNKATVLALTVDHVRSLEMRCAALEDDICTLRAKVRVEEISPERVEEFLRVVPGDDDAFDSLATLHRECRHDTSL